MFCESLADQKLSRPKVRTDSNIIFQGFLGATFSPRMFLITSGSTENIPATFQDIKRKIQVMLNLQA